MQQMPQMEWKEEAILKEAAMKEVVEARKMPVEKMPVEKMPVEKKGLTEQLEKEGSTNQLKEKEDDQCICDLSLESPRKFHTRMFYVS
jgi:hypothetical protein